ncbi:MAG: ubiquitin conjugating enzyme E2 [Amphiamblys sp. WSBS2006]|nr:MAG: ubiquitin conjugating enzyme E2 [Amphiamblys sp. WSBS2006]
MKHTGIILLFAALSVSCLGELEIFVERIKNEINNIKNEPASLVSITMFGEDKETGDKPTASIFIVQAEENNLSKWKATMKGPEGTPFEGGAFVLDVTLLSDYPFFPPAIRFRSEMFHPNIYGDGRISLDILGEEWSPSLSVLPTLLCIQSLLNSPNMGYPVENTEAAKLFRTDKEEYARRVKATFGRTNPDSATDSESSVSPRDDNTAEGDVDNTREERVEEVLD